MDQTAWQVDTVDISVPVMLLGNCEPKIARAPELGLEMRQVSDGR